MSLSSSDHPPEAEYRRRLDRHRALEATQAREDRRVANARIAVFLAAGILIWCSLQWQPVWLWWLFAPLALFVCLVIAHERIKWARQRTQHAIAYYERGLARLADQWPGKGPSGSRFIDENHPYAADLDIFGAGSLFERLCTAQTRKGEETLAAWLSAAAPAAEVRARQEAVLELRPRLDFREDLAAVGDSQLTGLDPAALAVWGTTAPVLTSPWQYLAMNAAVLLTIAALLSWWAFATGFAPFVAALLVEILVAVRFSARARRVLDAVEKAAKDLQLFANLLARLEREPVKSERLTTLYAALHTEGTPPSRRLWQLKRLIDWLNADRNQLFAPLAALLLWRTRFAMALDSWRARYGPAIAGWLNVVGEYEALCALATYSYENPLDPFPEVAEKGPLFEAEGIGHPLIPVGRSVRNDLRLGGELRVLVVSGSNMSGKSTLLRTVGSNTVLALAGAPVRARKLRLSPLTVGATLRVQDSLQAGRSRFYAEITRLRQLVDLAKGQVPLLFLLDEILHGTNSHDRRHGAEAVVRGLVNMGAIGLITTHDLALAEIAERLAPRAANVHFEDEFVNGAITFDYHMRPGVTRHSNALALMRAVGLDV